MQEIIGSRHTKGGVQVFAIENLIIKEVLNIKGKGTVLVGYFSANNIFDEEEKEGFIKAIVGKVIEIKIEDSFKSLEVVNVEISRTLTTSPKINNAFGLVCRVTDKEDTLKIQKQENEQASRS